MTWLVARSKKVIVMRFGVELFVFSNAYFPFLYLGTTGSKLDFVILKGQHFPFSQIFTIAFWRKPTKQGCFTQLFKWTNLNIDILPKATTTGMKTLGKELASILKFLWTFRGKKELYFWLDLNAWQHQSSLGLVVCNWFESCPLVSFLMGMSSARKAIPYVALQLCRNSSLSHFIPWDNISCHLPSWVLKCSWEHWEVERGLLFTLFHSSCW